MSKQTKFGKEAKIGVTVILLLLVGLGAALVRRLSGSAEPSPLAVNEEKAAATEKPKTRRRQRCRAQSRRGHLEGPQTADDGGPPPRPIRPMRPNRTPGELDAWATASGRAPREIGRRP